MDCSNRDQRDPKARRDRYRWVAFVVVLSALSLRWLHIAAAASSPLSHQLGPDEDYYLQFAKDVAFGSGGLRPEFAFMDPLYGYLLGAVLWPSGGNPFPMYIVQCLVDVATGVMLISIGRRLADVRAGLLAAGSYALVGPAIAMTAMLLKESWVAAYLTGWVLIAIRLGDAGSRWRWMGFGLYLGIGVLLRANLALLLPFGLIWAWSCGRRDAARSRWQMISAMLAGLALPLIAATGRNSIIEGRVSPLPSNGGVVLHQLYNEENPESRSRYPSFVRYGHPMEAWRAYRAEAERRLGRTLTAAEADAYWRGRAIDYLVAHPLQTLRNGSRKLAEFSAWPEVANNRSYADERLFSPILAALPPPFGVLFALGLPGLVALALRRSNGWLVWPPVFTGVATIAVFFAEDRFRLIVVPMFALGTGVWLSTLFDWSAQRRWSKSVLGLSVSLALGAWSAWYARYIEPTPTNWERIAAGWFKMGDHRRLREWLDRVERSDPAAPALAEYRGLLALVEGDPHAARSLFEAALRVRSHRHEVWHNYARALSQVGDLESSLSAELQAYRIEPLPEYAWEIGMCLEALGRDEEARAVFSALAANPDAGAYAQRARAHLDRLR